TLTVRNASDRAWTNARLQWICLGHPGMTLIGRDDKRFDLPAGAERTFAVTVRTDKGAYYGLRAVAAAVTATVDGAERTFMEGFEIVVAPRIRLEMFPSQRFPMTKGRTQPILIYLANGRSSSPGGPPDKFISSRAGPCKGVVGFDLPEGIVADPPEQAFDLPENGAVRLVFNVTNNKWGKDVVTIRPVVKFDGEKAFTETVHPGTHVIRDKGLLDYKGLDDQGLTFHANWDDPDKWINRAVNPRNHEGWGWVKFNQEGVKGYCANARSGKFLDPFKTVDYQQGTVLFWMKRDPARRNENQNRPDPDKTWKMRLSQGYGRGELICGDEDTGQPHLPGKSGVGLRRWPGWGGKEGYLEAVYISMGNTRHYVQVPWPNKRLWEWRHVALLWDMNARRLEVYVDGKLAGKADKGAEPWYGSPWDPGRPSGGTNSGFSLGSCDHGKISLTLRDEVYIYDRVLTPEQIAANMARVRSD
ncbi:hypothetical protein LCGC14_1847230, partial [marine sediment metagenome]